MSFKGLLSQIPSGLMPKDASEEDLHDYTQEVMKKVNFTSRSQRTAHTNQVQYLCSLIQQTCYISQLAEVDHV